VSVRGGFTAVLYCIIIYWTRSAGSHLASPELVVSSYATLAKLVPVEKAISLSFDESIPMFAQFRSQTIIILYINKLKVKFLNCK